MKPLHYLDPIQQQIRIVGTREQVLSEAFDETINSNILPRTLEGDFNLLAQRMYDHLEQARQTEEWDIYRENLCIYIDHIQLQEIFDYNFFSSLDDARARAYLGMQEEFEFLKNDRPGSLRLMLVKQYKHGATYENHTDASDVVLICYTNDPVIIVNNADVISAPDLSRNGDLSLVRESARSAQLQPGDMIRIAGTRGISALQTKCKPTTHRAAYSAGVRAVAQFRPYALGAEIRPGPT